MTPIPDLPPSPHAAFAIDMTDQPTLFEVIEVAAQSGTSVEPTGRKTATKTTSKRPRWTSLHGRDKCFTCVAEVVAGIRWSASPARLKRSHDGAEVRLCYEHAQPIRAADDAETARLKITKGRAA